MNGDPRSDAELVAAAALGGSGAQVAFGEIYDRYGSALYGFAASVLRNPTEAADAVQDIFLVAMSRIGTLREPEKLRSWLFSIARFDTMARVRKRARFADSEVPDVASSDRTPEQLVGADEVATVVWEAAQGLNERDRAVIELNVRQGLEGNELADALGMAPAASYVVLSRAKDQMAKAVGALLLTKGNRKDCDELAALLKDWDGRYTPLIRKRVARHAEDCDVCSRRSVAVVRALTALAAVPVLAPPAALRDQLLRRLAVAGGPSGIGASHPAEGDSHSLPDHWSTPAWSERGFPPAEPIEDPSAWSEEPGTVTTRAPGRRRGRLLAGAAAVVIVLGGAAVLAARSDNDHKASVTSAVASGSSLAAVETAASGLTGPTTTDSSGAPTSTTSGAAVAAPVPITTTATTTTAPTTRATTPPTRVVAIASPTTSRVRSVVPTTTSSRSRSRSSLTTTTAGGSSARLGLTPTSVLASRTGGSTVGSTAATTTAQHAPTSPPSPSNLVPIPTTTELLRPSTSGSPVTDALAVPTTTEPITRPTPLPTTAITPPISVTTTTVPDPTSSTTTLPVPASTSTTIAPTTTTKATTTTTKPTTTTVAPLEIATIQHTPDLIFSTPCQKSPTEVTLFISVAGGVPPWTAIAKLSNEVVYNLNPSGPTSFKTLVSFKSTEVASYSWAATVTDANGVSVTRDVQSKFVVQAC